MYFYDSQEEIFTFDFYWALRREMSPYMWDNHHPLILSLVLTIVSVLFQVLMQLMWLFFHLLASGIRPRAARPRFDRKSGVDCPNAILVWLLHSGVVDGHHAPVSHWLPLAEKHRRVVQKGPAAELDWDWRWADGSNGNLSAKLVGLQWNGRMEGQGGKKFKDVFTLSLCLFLLSCRSASVFSPHSHQIPTICLPFYCFSCLISAVSLL